MDDERWYSANIVFLSGSSCLRSSRTLELGASIVVSSCDNDCVSQRNQSDFKMVCYDGFFCIMGRTCFVFNLVWEWRRDCAWMGCLVTCIIV